LVEHSLGKGEVTSSILVIGSRLREVEVGSTWHLLRLAWSAVTIAYLLSYVIAAKRLRGEGKKHAGSVFWVIAALAIVRISLWYVLGGGLIYRLSVVLAGAAAGIAALDLARILITQKPDDGIAGTNERIQSLRLN
jgi:hypothetical protein